MKSWVTSAFHLGEAPNAVCFQLPVNSRNVLAALTEKCKDWAASGLWLCFSVNFLPLFPSHCQHHPQVSLTSGCVPGVAGAGCCNSSARKWLERFLCVKFRTIFKWDWGQSCSNFLVTLLNRGSGGIIIPLGKSGYYLEGEMILMNNQKLVITNKR